MSFKTLILRRKVRLCIQTEHGLMYLFLEKNCLGGTNVVTVSEKNAAKRTI